ncbi:hypothetical protein AAC387_Pa02g4469 [Persea americana]
MAAAEWNIDVNEEEPQNSGWLIEIFNEQEPQSGRKPRIQKVAETLRLIESNKTCFNPWLVSFGPYHHGEDHLKPMERYKKVAAGWFLSIATGNNRANAIMNEKVVNNVYDKFVAEVTRESSPRDYYANTFMEEYNQEKFMKMMFLDGCFILYFIHLFVERPHGERLLDRSHLNGQAILRDMFLLENQIPYTVLKALMSLVPNQSIESETSNVIEKFIDMVLCHKDDSRSKSSRDEEKEGEPMHLLDLIRSKLIGGSGQIKSTDRATRYRYYPFRSIMELKAEGIQVSVSGSSNLKDIDFKEGVLYGYLQLPQLTIDDNTKTSLLNLIAYEMCPDGQSDRAVITYICFLNSLIADDHRVTEDVKELRSKRILINFTGSDQEVARLFNDLARNLMPNINIYNNVMTQIEDYSKNRVKGPIANFLHTHFRSPWTIIIFIAGKLTVVSSVIQGLYYVWRFYK